MEWPLFLVKHHKCRYCEEAANRLARYWAKMNGCHVEEPEHDWNWVIGRIWHDSLYFLLRRCIYD